MGRFLLVRPRLVQRFDYQGDFVAPRSYPGGAREVSERSGWLYAPVDSNWADCRLTRKSSRNQRWYTVAKRSCLPNFSKSTNTRMKTSLPMSIPMAKRRAKGRKRERAAAMTN